MATDTAILTVTDAWKRFPLANGKMLTAVAGVSLSVYPGQCLAVIGESGCGKSTLIRLIGGITPMSQGRVTFRGKDIAGLKGREQKAVRRDMQMIFQNPADAISPRMKIGTFCMEPWVNFRLAPKAQARQEIQRALQQVSLSPEVLTRYPHQLSGGEKQRICIARAFSMHPGLLLCDEITSALDVCVQAEIMALFRRLQQETGTACLLICHDLALVAHHSDRVAVMYLGRIVEEMDSADLGTKAVHPYTQSLLRSMLFPGDRQRGKTLHPLAGEPPSPVNVPSGCPFRTRCQRATAACAASVPELREVAPGHTAACHFIRFPDS